MNIYHVKFREAGGILFNAVALAPTELAAKTLVDLTLDDPDGAIDSCTLLGTTNGDSPRVVARERP
jgi:hypothetical protein